MRVCLDGMSSLKSDCLFIFLLQSSTDQSTVDTDIPYRLAGLAFALIQLLSIIVLMSQVAWQVFLLFLAVLAISVWYQVRLNLLLRYFL